MEALFWAAAIFVAYVYVGYPVLLGVWAAVAARRARPAAQRAEVPLPAVSVIIAARNEAHRLPARIENLLASDYPAPLEIIVASDGSTDQPGEALAAYRDTVTLLTLPAAGKAAALNAAVAQASHPILVFADARQRFAPDAIRRLVAHFADAQTGAVSGGLVIDCDGPGSTIGEGVGAYWKYETWLRRREAIVGSTLGVTGAIYAMRRSLWQPLPADTILDDVLGPMRIVLRGFRVRLEPAALAFDTAAEDAATEMRRKIRTLAGNFQLLAVEPRLLVPGLNPVWLQFVSHKVGRLLVPYALVAFCASSVVLATRSWFYAAVLAGEAIFALLAIYGAILDRRGQRQTVNRNEVIRDAA